MIENVTETNISAQRLFIYGMLIKLKMISKAFGSATQDFVGKIVLSRAQFWSRSKCIKEKEKTN